MTVRPSERIYVGAEIAAARAIGMADKTQDGRGPIYYATGPALPKELRQRAARFRLMAKQSELVADAMEREQRRWP